MSSTDSVPTAVRTIVYIDGFNLYFGLVAQGWRKYLWLNLSAFSTSILKPNQQLAKVKYFTARITGPVDKKKRQDTYISALRTLPNVQIIEGRYQSDPVVCKDCGIQVTCPTCGMPWFDNNEKMSDVNIATQIMSDAYKNHFDEAILVTGDADQRPTIERTKALFNKRVLVCFPPSRKSYDLERAATSAGSETFQAPEEAYRTSQFSTVVDVPGGYTVVKPEKWNQK